MGPFVFKYSKYQLSGISVTDCKWVIQNQSALKVNTLLLDCLVIFLVQRCGYEPYR